MQTLRQLSLTFLAPPSRTYPVDARGRPIPARVCDKFEELALNLHAMGRKRYSSDAILHRIRWHFDIDEGDDGFKANDHWTAPLARWFLGNHPQCEGFFELRERVDDGYQQQQ